MRSVDLSVHSGKNRLSAQTGFLHYIPLTPFPHLPIPLFENFCFAFALFRQKTLDSVTSGKNMIERLLAFQTVDGNFPCYIHEYPYAEDPHLGLKIAPILSHLLKDFGSVLEKGFVQKVDIALKKMVKPPKNPRFEHRYQALLGNRPSLPNGDLSAKEWFEWIVSDQLFVEGQEYPIPYNSKLQAFLGKHHTQEGFAPEPVPIEYILAEEAGYHGRLKADHINQLYAALLYPFRSSSIESTSFSWKVKQPSLLFSGCHLHSIVAPNAIRVKDGLFFDLLESVEIGRDDLFETVLFCDVSDEITIDINGLKGTIFNFGDVIEIKRGENIIHLCFELLEGQGDFCGHISRANRPHQIALMGENKHSAYDWQIGLRTLRRETPCKVICRVNLR